MITPASHATSAAFSLVLVASLLVARVLAAGQDVKAHDSGPDFKTITNAVLADAYSKVNLKDGVNGAEAQTLADTYFIVFISGCGMADGVASRGDAWEVGTYTGYDMKPYKPIRVDKRTGQMMCNGYPTVAAVTGRNVARVIMIFTSDASSGISPKPSAN